MIYLTFGLGGICHDRPGLLAAGLGFPLELRHGRGIVAGLRMRPIGTRHTLLCHRITSGQSIAANRVRINIKRPPRWSGTASTHGTGYKPILTHQGGKGKKNMNIERRMEKVMERVCALCAHPGICTEQEELEELCRACPAEKALREALADAERDTAETMARAIAGAFEDVQKKYGMK